MCTAAAVMLLQVAATVQQGAAQAAAYKAEAQANEQNAKYALDQAKDAVVRGGNEESRLREQGRQFAASQKVGMAASGLDTGSGSALDALFDTASGIEQDAALIRYNAQRESWGYNVQATNYKNQANMNRAAAHNTKVGTAFSAASTVLNNWDTVSSKWDPMKKKPAPEYKLKYDWGSQ